MKSTGESNEKYESSKVKIEIQGKRKQKNEPTVQYGNWRDMDDDEGNPIESDSDDDSSDES